ncbi:hypothetical protein [Pseudomonas sp. RIT-PI-AD]|uniref:hypothetical protein n=1 Tax=Pseudomonas sp. RIT-PI-AD TaxID=3035294 RepID=UPI0021DB5431|nr:hypothetical protein [Pseudomonas sp. RIT-PI-AD]
MKAAWRRSCLGFAGLSLAILALVACWHPAAAAAGGLVGLVVGSALPLGSLLLALSLPLVDGAWRDTLGPGLRRGMTGLPGLSLMGLPVCLGLGLLYPWVGQTAEGFRGVYLSPSAFVVRQLLYLAACLGLWRLALDGQPRRCGLGAIALVLVSTLAAYDWLMALDPRFLSTLFGLLLIVRQLLAALAFAGLLALATRPLARPEVLRGLLLAGLLLWLYLHFMQYLIVWSVDLPDEIRWYQRRSGAGWGGVGLLLGLGQILLAAALGSPWGTRPGVLRFACLGLLLGGLLEALWLVLPALGDAAGGALPVALGLLASLGYAALLVALALGRDTRERTKEYR